MQTALRFRDVHPDKTRITALSVAIAAHVVVMMAMLVPTAAPKLALEPRPEWIPVVPFTPEPPPLPPEPEPVPVQQPSAPTPVPVAQPQPRFEAPPVRDAQPGDTAATEPPDAFVPTLPPATGGPVSPPDDGRPLQGARLEYAVAPAPSFPREAIRDGLSGTVLLQVLVDIDGTPIDVTVSRSSGHRVLDAAARKQVLARWKFRPAMRDGRAVQAIGLVPVEFRLD